MHSFKFNAQFLFNLLDKILSMDSLEYRPTGVRVN